MVLKAGAHIGHGAIIHGANIGANSLVGMNAVIMDDVNVGDECIIGALAFVKAGMQIPNRKMVVGNPATLIKDVTDEMIDWKTKGTALYQQLPKECYDTLKAVEPLREIPSNRPTQEAFYKSLEEFRKK
jgi:carbonic anhydrase/acetyltransferase-like protein (isoleucine patch superfamily)